MKLLHIVSWAAAICLSAVYSMAAPLVPGTGHVVPGVGDNFESEDWKYIHNNPKSSQEQDERTRLPGGRSTNGRWQESALRGHPDIIKRVETPEGGIEGSEGALLIGSINSGIPGRITRQNEQDDLIMMTASPWGRSYPASWSPSAVVRVYLPPFEKWENRTGTSFGFRTSVYGPRRVATRSEGFFGKMEYKAEPSWPGIFFVFNSGHARQDQEDSAYIIIRGRENGDFRGPDITETGWWTLGMSITPDGMTHYYASPGVDALTPEDRIASHYPYNFRIQRLDGVFFDTFNLYDGRTASTPWIIDDPALYANPPQSRMATQPRRTR